MGQGSFQPTLSRMLAIGSLILLSGTLAWSSSYKVIHAFTRNSKNPSSGLVVDQTGNAYGTTAAGGFHLGTGGTAYQLSPKTGFSLIYGFSGPDGLQPSGNLVIDPSGNLYGTTVYGGANKTGCNGVGCGTAFKLSPPTNGGAWTETVLYSFSGGDDGANPQAGVILDSIGNLYGTTKSGGTFGAGVIFQLVPSGDTWTEKVLYTFTGGDGDGGSLLGGLVFDSVGNLYGMSGATVFELSPSRNDWVFNVIHAFNPKQGDGQGAAAGLTFDSAGNLYGTTTFGGEFGFGTVFELTPVLGNWAEQVLYSFAGGNDGSKPEASVVLDAAGNIYGTTLAGGGNGQDGTVFQLSPGVNGQWIERLFRFPSDGSLGSQPAAQLTLDGSGQIYGTTTAGGRSHGGVASGVVFRISP